MNGTEWNTNISWNEGENDHFAHTNKRTEKSELEELKAKRYDSYFKQTYELINEIQFEMPAVGEAKTLLTMKPFSSIGLVDFIIKKNRKYPIETIFYIYSISSNIATKINEIAEKTQSTKIVISDLQNTAYREKERAVLNCLKSDKIEQIFVHSHAKIISLKFSENLAYTIMGSGNLANNARVEQYQIINDIGMFYFFDKTYSEIKKFQIERRNKDI